MIEFSCNGCGKRFSVPDSYANRRAKCKACGGDVQVPARPALAPPPSPVEPAPVADAATGESKLPLRTRRLIAEARQMQQAFAGSGPIRIESAGGQPPDRYRIRYQLKGLAPAEGSDQPMTRDTHLVEIECTAEYPRSSPRCRILTPIFHPNFDDITICVGDHWTAGERLVDLAVRIGEMIAYQAYNIKSPLNGEAAMWADLNRDRFPTDDSDLHAPLDRLVSG